MQKNWKVKAPDPRLQAQFSNTLKIHPIIAQLLINRDITTAEEAEHFLFGDLSHLHDPFLLKGMDAAIERIKAAKNNKQNVLIFGDYDVDGVTSSAILKNTLKKIGMDAFNYIPHRMNEGYGLNHAIVDYAGQRDVKLLIAVDCGITAFSQIEALNKKGIDVIVLDHHEPAEDKLPDAVAVVNPKRKDCQYPFNGLASAGLSFKLSQALLGHANKDYLDLVALGTIADVAELTGENRIFVREGLKHIAKTKNKGLIALIDVARIKGKKMKPSYVGFILGPRLNAAGRIDSAEKSLQLLLSEDDNEAYALAQTLESNNRLRQKTQNDIIEEALGIVEREVNFKDQRIIVLSKDGWHRGVVGIVASRISDMYYRPAIVISMEDDIGTGSARSIDGFHMFDALSRSSHLLENFGGHKHAAGLTIKKKNLEAFRVSINEFAKETLTAEDLIPTLEIDCEVALSDIDMDLVKGVEAMEPCGEGNPHPIFCSRNLRLKTPPVVLGRDTIKFWATDGKVVVQAVGFGLAKYFDLVAGAKRLDIAYSLSIDDWNKEPSVQLQLKDIKERE